eukprot:CAMPEP_0171984022 /NCGR_PEP_ID=MMETSP0993-20121228/273609_1 /TAXON_ID=483369 /ORGANISM="non described non described, Strain CCMP2098" /LENGTH=597 /DNA_ID=CAMNT_0012636823 /DNA_START=865 /DNA_END=2653 /DNA_ORIENTATION=+
MSPIAFVVFVVFLLFQISPSFGVPSGLPSKARSKKRKEPDDSTLATQEVGDHADFYDPEMALMRALQESEQETAAVVTNGIEGGTSGEDKEAKVEHAPRKRQARKRRAIPVIAEWDPAMTPPAVPKGSKPTPGGTRAVDEKTGEQAGTIETVTNTMTDQFRTCLPLDADSSPKKLKNLVSNQRADKEATRINSQSGEQRAEVNKKQREKRSSSELDEKKQADVNKKRREKRASSGLDEKKQAEVNKKRREKRARSELDEKKQAEVNKKQREKRASIDEEQQVEVKRKRRTKRASLDEDQLAEVKKNDSDRKRHSIELAKKKEKEVAAAAMMDQYRTCFPLDADSSPKKRTVLGTKLKRDREAAKNKAKNAALPVEEVAASKRLKADKEATRRNSQSGEQRAEVNKNRREKRASSELDEKKQAEVNKKRRTKRASLDEEQLAEVKKNDSDRKRHSIELAKKKEKEVAAALFQERRESAKGTLVYLCDSDRKRHSIELAKKKEKEVAAALFQERRESAKDTLVYLCDDWFATEASINQHAALAPGAQFVGEIPRRPITEQILLQPKEHEHVVTTAVVNYKMNQDCPPLIPRLLRLVPLP